MNTKIGLTAALFAALLASSAAVLADPPQKVDDPLRALLLESKEKNRGVNIFANGASIGCVVTELDEHYVFGRSQTTSKIIIRLDRIDGVSAMF